MTSIFSNEEGSYDPVGGLPPNSNKPKKEQPFTPSGADMVYSDDGRFAIRETIIQDGPGVSHKALDDHGEPLFTLLEWAAEDKDYVVIRVDADYIIAGSWVAIKR